LSKWFRAIGIVLALAIFSLNFISIDLPQGLPERLYLKTGEDFVLSAGLPVRATVNLAASGSEIAINGRVLGEAAETVDLGEPLTISANGAGVVRLSFRIAGMTIRNMTLLVDQDRVVMPGGQSIGVAMYTRGALVVTTGEIMCDDGTAVNPGKLAGIREGDVILSVNGEKIHNSNHLGELINNSREDLRITVLRADKETDLVVTPVKDSTDGKYRIGLWVRDSTAGIGTLTYADPMNQTFAGLGHAIADVDTSENLLLKEGQIVPARIIDVVKGEAGAPGELCGMFVTSGNALGKILINADEGLFGALYAPITSPIYPKGLPIGWQNEVELGHATILCTVDEQTVDEYDCEIVRINRQKQAAGKGMVVEIVDPRLLKRTNGIVQGMSGSPIIQNGKVVGAITHVLISDPHKGYGIFIEWMLAQSDRL
jgi:stage IV sporulation protein B